MDVKQLLLRRKRFFEEEVEQYQGPDPLKIRCEFLSWLEKYSKDDIAEIYPPLLEETLKLYMHEPCYKQDTRFIRLWLNYSITQPNPVDVLKNMHKLGLGTECAIFYSTWAEQLIRGGSISAAESVFKMGLNENIQSKADLQKQYNEFLMEIGRKVFQGKLHCLNCGSAFKVPSENGPETVEKVECWEWNPLKVGEVDDFHCPVAYFEEDDPTKIRMYPKDKVYPGNGQEFSLEEIRAAEYELKYKEEEKRERERALAAAIREEARTLEEETKIKEAEKLNAHPPFQGAFPVITPKMLNLPKDMDNSLANSTSLTVHTKEAMNVVQVMWSSPSPQGQSRHPFKNENKLETASAPINTPNPAPLTFEIYTEEEHVKEPKPTQKTPFQIYDTNLNPDGVQKRTTRSAPKPRFPVFNDDENAPPNQTPINQVSNIKTIDENVQSQHRLQLFKDDGAAGLAKQLETQAKIQPPMFDVQNKDDFTDVTCNTKAFDFILPSSTPLAVNKVRKALNSLKKDEPPKYPEDTNLSVILEQSKDKSGNSTASNLSSNTKLFRTGPLVHTVPDNFDPFHSSVIEELLDKIGFPKAHYSSNYFVKQTNLPTGTKTWKIGDETFSLQGELGKGAYAKVLKASNSSGNIVALKIEKPACRWEYYIAKEIQNRVNPTFASAFMDIKAAYIFNNGSILETQYAKYGSLISNINSCKENKRAVMLGVVLHFSLQLIDIVEHLHKCKIIHADLKPDNIVIRALPLENEVQPSLQLIDFGRCIDMSLYSPEVKFNFVFKKEDNMCLEMKENKPWTYQIDLQGLASLFYVLIFCEYMKVHKKNNKWELQKQIPRYMNRELWPPIFDSLLNVNPETDLPFNFGPMRSSILEVFKSSEGNHLQHIKFFEDILLGK